MAYTTRLLVGRVFLATGPVAVLRPGSPDRRAAPQSSRQTGAGEREQGRVLFRVGRARLEGIGLVRIQGTRSSPAVSHCPPPIGRPDAVPAWVGWVAARCVGVFRVWPEVDGVVSVGGDPLQAPGCQAGEGDREGEQDSELGEDVAKVAAVADDFGQAADRPCLGG